MFAASNKIITSSENWCKIEMKVEVIVDASVAPLYN